MENKRTLSIVFVILSIATFIICLFLNFNEFLGGGAATIKSVIVTFLYITVWIFVLIIGTISRNRGAVKYCLVFWFITFVAVAFANMTNTIHPVVDLVVDLVVGLVVKCMFPLMLLFMGQWYGLRFFVWNAITWSIIIAIISLVMVTIAVIWLKHNKST